MAFLAIQLYTSLGHIFVTHAAGNGPRHLSPINESDRLHSHSTVLPNTTPALSGSYQVLLMAFEAPSFSPQVIVTGLCPCKSEELRSRETVICLKAAYHTHTLLVFLTWFYE